MTRADKIHQRLQAALTPDHLEVIDDSESHRGHAGYGEGGESHFHVVIEAVGLAPLSRVARQRAIHNAIGPDLMGEIHALSMEIRV